MSENTLKAESRTLAGRKTNALRAEGLVPAVVYGAGTEPQNITLDRVAFVKMYKQAGESTIVELQIDEAAPLHVLIQDYQQDPVKDTVTHVDFQVVDMSKEIEATVDLVFVGESMAVKSLGGTLVQSRDVVTIKCLPNKLVRSFEVDLAKLETLEDVIHVSDLSVPEGVEILEDADLTIAGVQAPRSEEEMAALDEAVEGDVSAVEVEGEKKEGEEGADASAEAGEAKPADAQ